MKSSRVFRAATATATCLHRTITTTSTVYLLMIYSQSFLTTPSASVTNYTTSYDGCNIISGVSFPRSWYRETERSSAVTTLLLHIEEGVICVVSVEVCAEVKRPQATRGEPRTAPAAATAVAASAAAAMIHSRHDVRSKRKHLTHTSAAPAAATATAASAATASATTASAVTAATAAAAATATGTNAAAVFVLSSAVIIVLVVLLLSFLRLLRSKHNKASGHSFTRSW
jgi:Tfp pilus assembly protein FimV